MRKILLIPSLLLQCSLALGVLNPPVVTVNTNLLNLSGGQLATGANLSFELKSLGVTGSGFAVPRVPATGVFPPLQQTLYPNAQGNVTGGIYANDAITPSSTYYRVCANYVNQPAQCDDYSICAQTSSLNCSSSGTTFNLAAAIPLAAPPPTPPPLSASNTYILLNGGNNPTGSLVPAFNDLINLGAPSAIWAEGWFGATCVQSVALNVLCENADPTGAADSTSAINAACTAVGIGGSVLFPAGIFKVTGTLSCNYINFLGSSTANGPSGPNGTVINWASSGNGPVLSELGNGPDSSDLTARGTRIEGFNIENTGGASALVGIQIQDMQGVHIDHFNMVAAGGYCIKLLSTIQVERTSLGPDMHLECGDGVSTGGSGDVGFITTSGGGSFENTLFDGPKLDGHAIDVGVNSILYGSSLKWFGNAVTSTLMTIEGQLINSDLFVNIDANNSATCHTYYTGTNAIVAVRGFFAPRGCLGSSTLGSGAQFNVYQAGYSTDAGSQAMWNQGGNYDSTSGTYTSYIGTADRADLSGGWEDAFGLYANPSTGYFGAWLWAESTLHPNIDGLFLKSGASTIASSTVTASLTQDGTLFLMPQTYSNLNTFESCTSGTFGKIAVVQDSNTVTWGATIAGSSTNHVLAFCDGTNWTVAGK